MDASSTGRFVLRPLQTTTAVGPAAKVTSARVVVSGRTATVYSQEALQYIAVYNQQGQLLSQQGVDGRHDSQVDLPRGVAVIAVTMASGRQQCFKVWAY